jgi:hypothetical protein
MTRRIVERNFDPKKPLVARRDFVAAGRHYSVGDAFDWKRLSVAQRRVAQMFESNHVGHPDEQPEQEIVDTTPPPAPPQTSDLDVDSLAQLQAIARAEGAPIKTTKIAQRDAIIAHREAGV